MIDPLLTLALAIEDLPGGYALLLGSGISRPAGIPTGWGMTMDLVRRLAAADHVTLDDDEACLAWYHAQVGSAPDYSALLADIAPTSTERTQLLQFYFEPTADESHRGLKIPTPAHHAIAQLVKRGDIRVIVTTNFDHLMEQALSDQSITPVIISQPDHAEGAIPLAHARCTLIKVHGDYMDTRFRNTAAELDAYDPRMNTLLDQVFDEYGVIVCGWSGAYDTALRQALDRSPARRFTTYWAAYGETTPAADSLITRRHARLLPISNADRFFEDLAERVLSVRHFTRDHPLSAATASATVKRFIDDQRVTAVHDLFQGEVEHLRRRITDVQGPRHHAPLSLEEIQQRLSEYDTWTETAVALMLAGAAWGHSMHRPLIVRALEHLCVSPLPSSPSAEHSFARYPALVAFYAAGLGAIATGQYHTLATLFTEGQVFIGGECVRLSRSLTPNSLFRSADIIQVISPGIYPALAASMHLHSHLRVPLREYVASDDAYDLLFDRFEAMRSLTYADHERQVGHNAWGPPGRFASPDYGMTSERDELDTILKEAQAAQNDWPLFQAGLFGGSLSRLQAVLSEYAGQLTQEWR